MYTRGLSLITRIDSIENHCFLPQFLSHDAVVLDLGVNDGTFSYTISERYGVKCFGVEANPALCEKLDGSKQLLKFFNFAVAGKDEMVELNVSGLSVSSTIADSPVPDPKGSVAVAGKTLPTFLKEQNISEVDLMKVDVEGAEVGLFAASPDELLRQIRQISIEFHDEHRFMTSEQFAEIRDRLFDLGFAGIKFSGNNTNWLFFQRDLIGPLQRTYVKYLVRNVRGALRRAGLRFG
jgi:FkbM family methyltransferase